MPAPLLPDYLRLNRANGRAPHKPILLLAVLKAMDEGLITENRITPSAELINLFNGYWAALVKEEGFQRRFYLPFFYMKNEASKLWTLRTLPGFEHALTRGRDIKSLGALVAYQACGELRHDVYKRWLIAENRAADRLLLVAKYFSGQSVPEQLQDRIREFEYQIAHDPPETYLARKSSQQDKEEIEEEKILRGAAFKRMIPELYGYRCAITGLHIVHNQKASLIDACHIVPWAEFLDDTITNGIALCPNMHRAFDRGLISVAADHTVLVSNELREAETVYAIRPFAGKRLILPQDEQHHPALKNLAMHRERFGFV